MSELILALVLVMGSSPAKAQAVPLDVQARAACAAFIKSGMHPQAAITWTQMGQWPTHQGREAWAVSARFVVAGSPKVVQCRVAQVPVVGGWKLLGLKSTRAA